MVWGARAPYETLQVLQEAGIREELISSSCALDTLMEKTFSLCCSNCPEACCATNVLSSPSAVSASCAPVDKRPLWQLVLGSKMDFEIRHTRAKGRHIVTKGRHSFGQVILQQEPYAAVLYDDQQTRCQYSFAVVEDLKRYKKQHQSI